MGGSQVIVVCQNPSCSKEFSKQRGEFNRSEKLAKGHFCSKVCFGKFKGLINFGNKANKDTSYLRNIVRTDDLSPFRNHLKVMRKSAKHRNHECSVTLLDLKALWEKQKGVCPCTGWNLVLLPSTTDYENTALTINRASVDRIDSSQGYTIENIQFVAVIANFAKNVFTEAELINFCHDVYNYRILGKNNSGCGNLENNICTSLPLFNRRDEYSPYRQHLRLARRRVKLNGRECNITLEYLKALWEQQDGRCVYTGWELENLEATSLWDNHKLHPRTASLDRIDSMLGYVPGNVQFVSVMANYAKRDFWESQLLEFCKAVFDFRVKNYKYQS
jgi:hypothetical protein